MAIVAEYDWELDTYTQHPNGATNGHSPGVSEYEESLDNLYSWMPPQTPALQPCPEAVYSLTLRGRMGGQDAMLTVRGQTAAAFKANLASIKGLLDPVAAKVQAPQITAQGPDPAPLCPHHGALKASTKGTGWYCPVKVGDSYCTSRAK
jgi:hypothetical protein